MLHKDFEALNILKCNRPKITKKSILKYGKLSLRLLSRKESHSVLKHLTQQKVSSSTRNVFIMSWEHSTGHSCFLFTLQWPLKLLEQFVQLSTSHIKYCISSASPHVILLTIPTQFLVHGHYSQEAGLLPKRNWDLKLITNKFNLWTSMP